MRIGRHIRTTRRQRRRSERRRRRDTALDQSTWGQVENARADLIQSGRAIFPAAIKLFPELRGFSARTALVNTAMKFARVEPDAVRLGLLALSDKSVLVRERGCLLLAVSLNRDVLPALEALSEHPNAETRADAAAARAAIEAENLDLYVDRTGTGRTHLAIGSLVFPG